jgi:hypothetical protein
MEGVLDRIVKRPELVRELGRQERIAAFAQLVFVAGPILSAFAEMGVGQRRPPHYSGLGFPVGISVLTFKPRAFASVAEIG